MMSHERERPSPAGHWETDKEQGKTTAIRIVSPARVGVPRTPPRTGYLMLMADEFAADTAHMDPCDVGILIRLMVAYWRRRGPLPNSDTDLARIALVDSKRWKRSRPAVEMLFKVRDGVWHHDRIDYEIAMDADRRAKAQASARSRWSKSNAPGA
jgi:uncharacterized protein YdaU (DUF1376 family)